MKLSTDNKQLQKNLEDFLWNLKEDLEMDLKVCTHNDNTWDLLKETRRVLKASFGWETATELLKEKE